MPDVLVPPPPDPAIGYTPIVGGSTTAALIAAIGAMSATDIRAFILSGGGIVQASRSLSVAEINSLNSSPITLIPFAGLPAQSVIIPIWWTLEQRLGATIFSAAPDISLQYAGVGVNICGNDAINNTANEYRYGTHDIPAGSYSLGVGVRAHGKDVVLTSTADRTLGSGTFLLNYGYMIQAGALL